MPRGSTVNYSESMTSSTPTTPPRTSASAPTVSAHSSDAAVSLRPARAAGYSSPHVTLSTSATRVRIEGVELLRIGNWDAGTGPFNVTTEVIRSAAQAAAAGILRAPVIRIGHTDPRFDGEPALGWLENIRTAADDTVLLGDMAGVPKWLADNIESAYPSRSIEGRIDWQDPEGTTWPFVLDAVALLGTTPPAVESLADLRGFVTARRGELITAAAARRRRRATYKPRNTK